MVTMNYYRLCQSRLGGAYDESVCADGVARVVKSWATSFSNAMISVTESLTAGGICLLGEYNEPGINKFTVTGMLKSDVVGVYPPASMLWGINNGCLDGSVTLGLQGLQDGTTIKGIALFCNGTTGDGNYYNVLMDVTPLDKPIVINRCETLQLTYTIRLNSGQ